MRWHSGDSDGAMTKMPKDEHTITALFQGIQNIALQANARATLEVRVSNQVNQNSPFAVDYGPLQLTFSNVATT